MRDYTTNDYCDFLWINDILSLKKWPDNEFRAVLRRCGRETTVTISNVTIFGTVVDIKEIGEKGVLYSIDDGTGVIVCKYNDQVYQEIFDTIQTERTKILNETFVSQTENESQINYSVSDDDTIFNDRSIQEDEEQAIHRNKLKALHSIWADIEDSFSSMLGGINISDTILVQGKLYTYRNIIQIHVNTIRVIDIKEEMLLTSIKLEDGYEPLVQPELKKNNVINEIQLIEKKRHSGVMTFDHIHHLETKEIPTAKFVVSKESCNEKQETDRKRKSFVPPQLCGSMTFDTFTDLNNSGPVSKIAKMGDY